MVWQVSNLLVIFMESVLLLFVVLLIFLLVGIHCLLVCVYGLFELTVHTLHSKVFLFLELLVGVAITVRFRASAVVGRILDAVVAQGLKQLQPIGQMIHVALCDFLPRYMVEIQLDD